MPMTEREALQDAYIDGWQQGHDLVCEFAYPGRQCPQHPNPYIGSY